MDLDFRRPTDDEWPAFFGAMQETFIETWPPGTMERMKNLVGMARPIGGFDGDRVEATGGAYRHVMRVPGATLPCSGITWITVSARQRRRGALREMMRRLQEAGAEEGEPIAALYAAEGAIYGRFGFGVAARTVRVKVEARQLAALPQPAGEVVEVDPEDARVRFPAIFDAATANRPGVVLREAAWWDRVLHIAASPFPGWMAPRHLVYVDAGGRDRGAAVVRLQGRERGLSFDGRCRLTDLHAIDAEAASAIWRYAGSFDLVNSVSAPMRPSDEALPFMVTDLRQVRLSQDTEVWVHLTDPVAALQGRRYRDDGHLRFRVDDPSWPRATGTYELEISGGVARCTPSSADPELELGASELGAIYLGATSPHQLAAAGRIVERVPGAVANADRILHSAPAAWGADLW
jgi:predicted acetyltransferase